MKILMVSYDMQDFGGLEEYAVNLAIGLKQQGQDVSHLSAAWVSPGNQYSRRLHEANIPLVQPPAWISRLASDWSTKENILRGAIWILYPCILLLGLGLSISRQRPLKGACESAHHWLQGQLMGHFIGRDYRRWICRVLLDGWRLRWHPDLVHIQGYTAALLFVIDWAHVRGIPVAYEEHSTPDARFTRWSGLENSINKADRVIAVSEKSAQGLREVCGVTRPIVVCGPLLRDPFEAGWQKAVGHPGDRPVTITTIARLHVAKGLAYLLEAAAIVKKTHPDARFKLYGEGELRNELLERAERLGLDGRDIFVGAFTSREELNHIMARTDIFLLSSILEGQPLVIVEAMAYGCPIVSTHVGGIPELITDGVNGLLCPPADPHCLAEKLQVLIDDPAQRERLGRAARSSYERSSFEPKSVAKFFISVYGQVLEERKGAGGLNRCRVSQEEGSLPNP